jgi:hypothetical protein
MATMADKRAAIRREEQWLLKIILDRCSRQNKFMYAAEATCAATALCYYTFATCQDTTNYNKETYEWQFCNRMARIPGALPYLKPPTKMQPTEINPKSFTTSRGDMTFELVSDTAGVKHSPDKLHDVAKQSSALDTGRWLWNWIKRNPAFRGKVVELYHGAKDVAAGSFELKFRGVIDDIVYTPDVMSIKCKDLLWSCVLADTPAKIATDITVNDNPLGAADVTLTLDKDGDTNFTASDHFETPDYNAGASTVNQYRYVKIENEIMAYTGITDEPAAALTGLVRGVMGTTAAAHVQATAIAQVNYYGDTDATDAAWTNVDGLPAHHIYLDLICNLGGVSADYIDTTATSATVNGAHADPTVTSIAMNNVSGFPSEGVCKINDELLRFTANSGTALTVKRGCYGTTAAAHGDTDAVSLVTLSYWLDNWMQGDRYRARFEASKKVKERINSLRESTGVYLWVNEDGEIEGDVDKWAWYSSTPDSYTIADFADKGRRKVSRNELMRITRVTVLGDPQSADPGKKYADYDGGLKRRYIDGEAEGANSFNETRERVLYCEWIYRYNEANRRAAREFALNREVRHGVEFTFEFVNEDKKVGDIIELSIPEIVDVAGAQDSRYFRIIKKTMQSMGKYLYKVIDSGFGDKRYCVISSDADDYDATSADKNIYGWISDGNDKCGAADDDGYNIF